MSSPRSMVFERLADGRDRPISLICGQRTLNELHHHDKLAWLAAMHRNGRHAAARSTAPQVSIWRGACGLAHEAARSLLGSNMRGRRAYLCGPPAMIEACVATLLQGRLFERDIFTVRFLAATNVPPQAKSPHSQRIRDARE